MLSRLFAFHRLWLDDAFAISAWLMLLVQAITWQTQVDTLYLMFWLVSGRVLPTLENLDRISKLLRAECVILVLFYCSLWSIKASFLIFFHRIGGIDRRWLAWFWCVVFFVGTTFLACVADIQYNCLLRDQRYIQGRCSRKL